MAPDKRERLGAVSQSSVRSNASAKGVRGDFAAISLTAATPSHLLADLMALRTLTTNTSSDTRGASSSPLPSSSPSSEIANAGESRKRIIDANTTGNLLAVSSLKKLCSSPRAFRKACRAAQASGWSFSPDKPVTSSIDLAMTLLAMHHHPQSYPRNLTSFHPHRLQEHSSRNRLSLSLTLPGPLEAFTEAAEANSPSAFEATLRYAPPVPRRSTSRNRKAVIRMTGGSAEPVRRSRLRRILNAIISRKNRVTPADGGLSPYDASSLDAATSGRGVLDGEKDDDADAVAGGRRKRVLILMSDTGGGHRASAEALKATFELEYGDKYEVTIVDSWKDHTPFPFNQLPKSYSFLVRHETLWKMAFHATKPRFVHQPQMAATGAFVAREAAKMLDIHRPDIMVSVHPLMQHIPLRVLRSRGLLHRIPFSTVVTDLTTCHPTWFHKWVTLCFCPTKEVAQRALKAGLTPPQLRIHGLPIRPAFSRPPSMPKEKLRAELGMDPVLPAAILIGGGEGMGPVEATALALAKRLGGIDDSGVECEPKGQLVVVCGRNKKLRAKLEAMDWPMPTQIMGFVSNMPDLMAACDCIITKAGPGTIAESFIRGLPLVLNDFIPGQEVGNVPYVVDNGAGVFCDVPREIGQIVSDWFGPKRAEFEEMAERARALARPDAVFRIVRDLDSLVCGEKLVAQSELAYA